MGYSPWGHKEWDTTERRHFISLSLYSEGFPHGSVVKNPPANEGDRVF